MSIKTFGSEKEELQNCEVVKVAMKTVDGAFLDLLLFTVPLICEPLNNQPINFCKDEYDYLIHLTLADACDSEDMPIDILIGLDYYWQTVTSEVIQGKKGPTAVRLGIITLHFRRLIFSVSSSPFLLNATVQHHLQKYFQLPTGSGKDLSFNVCG